MEDALRAQRRLWKHKLQSAVLILILMEDALREAAAKAAAEARAKS